MKCLATSYKFLFNHCFFLVLQGVCFVLRRLGKKTPSFSHFKNEELAFPGCKRQLLEFQLKELLGLGRQRPTSEISFSGIYEDQAISSSFSFFSNWLLLMLWKHCAVFVWRMEKYDGWWNEPDWPYSWGNACVSFMLCSCIQWCSLNLYEF